MRIARLIVLLLLASSWSCADSDNSSRYRIGPGDTLEIMVLRQAELSRTVTVLPDGYISYPAAGNLRVSGLTVTEVESQLTEALKALVNKPRVTVVATPFKKPKVYVQGSVKIPGAYDLTSHMRLSDAIGLAGGAASDGDLTSVVITPSVKGQKVQFVDLAQALATGDLSQDPELSAGDTISVPEARKIYVHGEVVSPGNFAWKRGFTLRDYLGLAGGPTRDADTSQVLVASEELAAARRVDINSPGSDSLILSPGSTVRLLPAKRVFVIGMVSQPGAYIWQTDWRLSQYVALAGGPAKRAKLTRVLVVPASGGKMPTTYDLLRGIKSNDTTQNPKINPGDTIYVSEISFAGFQDLVTALELVARNLMLIRVTDR